MKRKILFILLSVTLVAMISAQDRGERQSRFRRPAAESVTVSGAMIVAHGMPALKSSDVTYIVGGISRLIGFVDGLKEGAQVTVEGRAFTNPNNEEIKFLMASKLTIGGRDYDLAPLEFNPGNMGQWWRPPQGPPAPHSPRQRWS